MTVLTDQPWLTAPSTRAVMAALEAAGGPDCARFVGGCVRNALIGAPVDDIDIATTLKPTETERALRAAGLRAVPTGIAHGTVTGVADGAPFEITTLRRDVSTDGRNATVAFTDDWAEDAGRRDFRLNALYADAAGRVFDPTGQGIADALAGRIVFVGDPDTRIREDYLRILRFFRFFASAVPGEEAEETQDPDTRIREDYLRILRFFRFFAWYGRGEPDADALAACAGGVGGMGRVSAERVSRELMKLMAAPDPVPALNAMRAAGVLAAVLPEAELTPAFAAAVAISGDPVVRLAALLPDEAETARQAATRLRFPNLWRDRLAFGAAAAGAVDLAMTPPQARAALYRHGRQAFEDAVRRHWARAPDQADQARELLAWAETWVPPRMPVGGRDAARLGAPPGPETGRVLKAFEEAWIGDDFPADGHEARLAALITPPRG